MRQIVRFFRTMVSSCIEKPRVDVMPLRCEKWVCSLQVFFPKDGSIDAIDIYWLENISPTVMLYYALLCFAMLCCFWSISWPVARCCGALQRSLLWSAGGDTLFSLVRHVIFVYFCAKEIWRKSCIFWQHGQHCLFSSCPEMFPSFSISPGGFQTSCLCSVALDFAGLRQLWIPVCRPVRGGPRAWPVWYLVLLRGHTNMLLY